MTFTSTSPRWYATEEVAAAISPDRARRLVQSALESGFDPADDPDRINTPAGSTGHWLLMPSSIGQWTGIKVATVSPDNPALGHPRIQATYLLLDAQTLAPVAAIEGSLLTELRTPAVSAVAADRLAPAGPVRLAVVGTGPQAVAHVAAMAQIRDLEHVAVFGRDPRKVEGMLAQLADQAHAAAPGTEVDLAAADLIVCATSAAEPLFDGSLVKDGACVVAMGSHEPDRRELDAALMARAKVVVEDVDTALREAGDVVMALEEGVLHREELVSLRALVAGEATRATGRPNVFKSVGMSWQDLAVAIGVVDPTA